MNDLIDTTEMYLRTIFELEEEGITPLRARIAERLHQSGPTVSQTVARMERDGLLSVQGDRHLQLSDEGRALATAVMRKHRLAECLLVDVIGLDYADVHEEACRWEHVMSEAVERKLLTLLNNPTVSPFGNPIPGLDALGGDTSAVLDALTLLSTTATPEGRQVVVRRISEQLQEDGQLLRSLADLGVRPGSTVTASLSNGTVLVDGQPLEAGVAQHVFVSAVDDDLTPVEAAEATAGVS
ncbi:metal-dependent transcriptional regulator [Modestobacter roseus]|uniref:DtxR family iron (Metal) dependent repressor n=1 Tax=Modestobacter roseus TaxID=1181884 RepID=A0A562IS11_9ACTN|nr:metal-dependent transcriptional regulator [Modestobacter roseus]MQA31966.1 dihydrofolate reductase [Modestobacter roseus]TWH73503.1 DtxR family iron (metal) dependent repressor [Modestobacter roseus]